MTEKRKASRWAATARLGVAWSVTEICGGRRQTPAKLVELRLNWDKGRFEESQWREEKAMVC